MKSCGYGFTIIQREPNPGHWRVIVRDMSNDSVVEVADFHGADGETRSGEHFDNLERKYRALY